MKFKLQSITVVLCLIVLKTFANDDSTRWSVRMAETEILHGWSQWVFNYVSATDMKGFRQLWQTTGEERYFQYIKESVDDALPRYHAIISESPNWIDPVNGGSLILMMYSQTKEEKYKAAIDSTLKYLLAFDRTTEGGFVHKFGPRLQIDDLYMEGEFLAEYAHVFNRTEELDEALLKTRLMEKHMRDPVTGLWTHGWLEETDGSTPAGPTPFFWGRGMGWAAMAIVDMLDWWPAEHVGRDSLIGIFQRYAQALASVQDDSTGVWWQVLDQPGREGNWLESSGSCMFVYALAKGVRLGYIDESYRDIVEKGYQGILDKFIRENADSTISITHVCPGQGPSYEYSGYIRKPTEDGHAVGPFIMASLEIEATATSIQDVQNVIPNTIYLSNYPNPFNPTTKIKFNIPYEIRNGVVTLKIYDILGREITTLLDEVKQPGEYEIKFDTSKYNLSGGVYFYNLKTADFITTKKMVVLP